MSAPRRCSLAVMLNNINEDVIDDETEVEEFKKSRSRHRSGSEIKDENIVAGQLLKLFNEVSILKSKQTLKQKDNLFETVMSTRLLCIRLLYCRYGVLVLEKASGFHKKYEELEKKYNLVVQENEKLRVEFDKVLCEKQFLSKENERLLDKIQKFHNKRNHNEERCRPSVTFSDEVVCI